ARQPRPRVVDRAPRAVADLEPLDGCAGVESLPAIRAAGGGTRARFDELRDELDRAGALAQVGGGPGALAMVESLVDKARAFGDDALLAEALHVAGRIARVAGKVAAVEAFFREALLPSARAHADVRQAGVWIDLMAALAEQGGVKDALAMSGTVESAL